MGSTSAVVTAVANGGSRLLRLAGRRQSFCSSSTSVLVRGTVASGVPRRASRSYGATTRSLHLSTLSPSVPSPVECPEGHERPLSYRCEPGTEPLVNWTYGNCIDRAAALVPDRRAYVFAEEQKTLTFAEFQDAVNRCAKGLLGFGLKKGDSLMILAPTTANWLILFAACAKIGVMTASVHPGYSKQELFSALNKVRPTALFAPEAFKALKFYENLCKWIPELAESSEGQLNSAALPYLNTVIMDSERSLPGTVNVRDILAGGSANLEEQERLTSCDDALTVIFTSGTTGSAKAACLSHHGFVNNVRVAQSVLVGNDGPLPVILNPLPLFHVFGLMNASLPFFTHGMTVFPSVGYDTVSTLKAIHKYRCTDMSGSPTMYVDLIQHQDRAKYDLSSLRRCIMGGNICTTEVRQLVETNLKPALALTGYGATETSTAATGVRMDDPVEKRLNTVGRPLPHTEIKIVNPDTGVELPCGEVGEVWIRGFQIFCGYLGEEAKTKEVMTPARWYRSGDVGTMDTEGYVSLVGRLKDLIIRGGENVHPIDIEVALDQHPAVEESHVVGVPDQRLGEEICAVVIVKEGSRVEADELRQFLKDKVAYFKIPKYILFEHDVAKTAIGKAQKNKIRALAAAKLGLSSL